ncbi:FAD-dependent monooxygenase [Nocardioides mesophilus]|uniref:FAD-dependent monooxygenase n=1 Tax=Nocardioides mesophilus TaxID=433659 RepID=A0A7G9R6F9_9ACTN|nr:FAD-dependent monooxygenase [Nocardioides mesophilus]QNN51184.1 FAD-dependent monooxygenase [Nocardioides mesophilus]
MSATPDVLVVGAGPTGLATALQAHDHGAAVRVVDRRPDAFRPSRAMVMHSRTLDSLRPLGVTDALLERADVSPRAELHLGRRRVRMELAELDLPDTGFPHLTLLRQADVEEVLADALTSRGVDVERGTELVHLRDDGTAARGTLRTDGRTKPVVSRFVAGCDGPASTVRAAAHIGWRGGSYREEVLLADVELDGDLAPGTLHAVPAREGLVFLFALGEGATWRLLATRPHTGPDPSADSFGQPGEPIPVEEVDRLLRDSGLGVGLAELRWSARVPLQHRLADSFRRGPSFLAGDAAHAHSPAAAQGMNTGLNDAVNLGWKLAFAARGPGHEPLLDSYEQERRPVARQVLSMTHLVFFAEASTNPFAGLLRSRLVPLAAPALPLLLSRRWLVAEGVRILSQLRVEHRHSVLSVDGTPPADQGPRPGDRLPDETVTCEGTTRRLHEVIAAPGVHVLLSREAGDLDGFALGPRVAVHRLTSRPGPEVVAVRPDGYVGFRCGRNDPAQLAAWLELVGAR